MSFFKQKIKKVEQRENGGIVSYFQTRVQVGNCLNVSLLVHTAKYQLYMKKITLSFTHKDSDKDKDKDLMATTVINIYICVVSICLFVCNSSSPLPGDQPW